MTLQPLQPGCMYHIYNHAVGNDNLFLKPDNYYYFLRRYDSFISPIADTYCYCLMPNHLHFFTEIKTRITIRPGAGCTDEQYISKQFSNLFSSYAQAFNKQNYRKGNLFRVDFAEIWLIRMNTLQTLSSTSTEIHSNMVLFRIFEPGNIRLIISCVRKKRRSSPGRRSSTGSEIC